MTVFELSEILKQFNEQSNCYIDCYQLNSLEKFDICFEERLSLNKTEQGFYFLSAENGFIDTVRKLKEELSKLPHQNWNVYLSVAREFGIEDFKVTEAPFITWRSKRDFGTSEDFSESTIILIQSLAR